MKLLWEMLGQAEMNQSFLVWLRKWLQPVYLD